VNEHTIEFTGKVGVYAIVFFSDLRPEVVIVFPKQQLKRICERLGKEHGKQDTQLQLTPPNFKQILAEKSDFAGVGVRIWGYDNLQQQWEEWKKAPNSNLEQ